MSIHFSCDLSDKTVPFPHFWEVVVGSGHAPLALRADWQAQLKQCHDELGFKHVRFHGLLSSTMDTLITVKGKPLYSFFNADSIFDFLVSIGVKPFVELSFMPNSIASGNKKVFHYQSNVTPPKNYAVWADLIKKLVTHWVERYGKEEVRQWFFEIWNEPNLASFWTGSQNDYFKLYSVTAKSIKKIDPRLQVGGPVTAKNMWIYDFVNFCTLNNVPLDFVSTHHYPTDAFGKPGDDTEKQLADSRRSIMREEAQNVFNKAQGKSVYYTEWSSSSNPRDKLHDEPYAAAFVTKTIMEAQGLVKGYSYWTFSDIFQENYFPSTPFQGGFGLLNINGIPKPTYRAFQLLHDLGTEQLLVDGLHPTVDAWVIKKNTNSYTILLTNHAFPKHFMTTETIKVTLHSKIKKCSAVIRRVDDNQANPKKKWVEMGKPEYLNAAQVKSLKEASLLQKESLACTSQDSKHTFEIVMLPHSVVAVTVEFNH